jgi:hypothetical protein
MNWKGVFIYIPNCLILQRKYPFPFIRDKQKNAKNLIKIMASRTPAQAKVEANADQKVMVMESLAPE